MWLPTENICGILGSALLLLAPARDQILRHYQWFSAGRAAKAKATKKYWDVVVAGYERERNAWHFLDTATMALGALLIGASYVINAAP